MAQGGKQPVQWMAAPQAIQGCPPGLEYLTQVDQLLVHQQVELLEGKVIHIERPLRCQAWCCFCCLQKIEVQSPPGTVVGYVKQDLSFIYPWFTIENADGEPVLKIKGPCWTCKWCEVEFEVLSVNGEQQVGKISKQWSGLAKEYFTDADNFGIQFPMDLDVKMKAVMIGAVFLIDFMFFERSGNN
ncbi:Phospholipid scramblase 2 [Geodia barretti]|uniref:Phospholipid scramblase n=1 Tax=Geodia barretti TaxID=519541 RepID=A0AA35TAN8_GEOBA|nr:Phospholipid scramblase 2 [Geodia barretti]